MKLTRQQVLDLLVRAEAAGLLPADGPTSLFVAQKRGAPLQLAVAAADSKIVVRQSRLPFFAPPRSFPERNWRTPDSTFDFIIGGSTHEQF